MQIKMGSHFIFHLSLLLTNILIRCASAAVHSHNIENLERESDGSFRPRDFNHYTDSGHNTEFDHEVILGSLKKVEEFDNLSPEESRRRLLEMLPEMDLNGDKKIDRLEMKKWIINSFSKLTREETEERLSEADENRDGLVSWAEYLRDGFGVDSEDEVEPDAVGDTGTMLQEEKAMWMTADLDGDGSLDINEFEMFLNPEEFEVMHPILLNQTLREKDTNKDGVIDFREYLADRGSQQERDKEWMISETDKFEHDLDLNKDGVLDMNEIHRWIIPDNDEIAEEEVDHLINVADEDQDQMLSFEEILRQQNVFVGSSASSDLLGEHFDDEL